MYYPLPSGRIRIPAKLIEEMISSQKKTQAEDADEDGLANFEDNQPLFVQGGQIHSALLRMWIE